jgi:hypothetical protein
VSEVGVLVGAGLLPKITLNTMITATPAPVIHGQRRLRFGCGGFGGQGWPYCGIVMDSVAFQVWTWRSREHVDHCS